MRAKAMVLVAVVVGAMSSMACVAGEVGSSKGGGGTSTGARANPTSVRINGQEAPAAELARLGRTYGVKVANGDYWHDKRSGLAGRWGGPAQAYAPGFDFGAVPRDASSGSSGILFNGRDLTQAEVTLVGGLFGLSAADMVAYKGSYVLEQTGDLYSQGDGSFVGNLVQLANQRYGSSSGGGGGGDNFWSTSNGAAGNSQGGCSYVSFPGGGSVSSGCG